MARTTVRRVLAALTGAVLAVSLALALLAGLVYAAGTNEAWMHAMLRHHAPPSATGLPEDEYRPMAAMITSFLSGERSAFQHEFERAGVRYQCFARHEQQHMDDCRALFALCRSVLTVSCVTAAVAALTASGQRRRLRRVFQGMLTGFSVLLAAMAVLLVWGAADFDGLFVLFHQLSFANDLWLLNPATDLLIRLMPTGFFVSYAAIIGGCWFALCAAMTAFAAVKARRMR